MTAKGSTKPMIGSRSASTPFGAHPRDGDHTPNGADSQRIHKRGDVLTTVDPLLATIRTLGGILDDLERVRIMASNRVAAQEREYGSAVPHLDIVLEPLKAAEHQAQLELVRAWRLHPLAPWAKAIKGIGEKSIARLIAHTGDPASRATLGQFRAYCGLGDPARKRRRGMTQEEAFALGNPAAKKQCWLIGEAIVKHTGGPYRAVYDEYRGRYADRVHAEPCVRCGPSGKPAPAGSPWSLKHQHEAAKRAAVKAFLKDLWLAARDDATTRSSMSIPGPSPMSRSTCSTIDDTAAPRGISNPIPASALLSSKEEAPDA